MTIRKGKTIIAGNSSNGLEIGDIGLSAIGIDESLNYRRYLNGQEILQAQFPEFTKKIKRRVELYPSLACTNIEYETACTLSTHGQCGKFVIDNERGVIRLPKVVNVMGLSDMAEAGVTVEAGLPNITGNLDDIHGGRAAAPGGDGVFKATNAGTANGASSAYGNYASFSFDASRSNPIYGNSETVQQEAIKYPYFIQVASSCETTINLTRDIELNNPFSLFEYKFSEYAIDNISWLESKGQWNSNKVYVSAYEELLAIYNGKVREGVSVKKTTETYTDYDFVIDEAGSTFRLPIRVKETPLSAGKVGVAGNGMTIGLTNGTTNAGMRIGNQSNIMADTGIYGTNADSTVPGQATGAGLAGVYGLTTDATKSGIEADLTDAVVDLKLYFYVGETVQDGNLINAGAVLEDVNTLKNTALTTSQITNCITEIPQRIKLELKDGTLTLKAGSEVIVPNGFEEDGVTPKFDYMTTERDITITGYQNLTGLIYVGSNIDVLSFTANNQISSGATGTLGSGNIWYDTTNNKVFRSKDGSYWDSQQSFPLCSVSCSDGAISSINCIFNGMGYIGSTVWVDKGVKALIPNGRNEDGSLKNIEVVPNKVHIYTFTGGYADTFWLRLSSSGTLPNHATQIRCNIKSFSDAPTPASNKWYSIYVEDENMFYYSNNGGVYYKDLAMDLGVFSASADNKITSLKPKQPFRAVGYNDKSEVSGWGMPSRKHFYLTLGASGSIYTAPANGWFSLQMFLRANANTTWGVRMTYHGTSITVGGFSSPPAQAQGEHRMIIPIKKGEQVRVEYSYTSTYSDTLFSFNYAEGAV